jgi:hypothetical protein
MGNVKSSHNCNETAAEDVNIDEIARPIPEPVAPTEDEQPSEASIFDVSDALVSAEAGGRANALVGANAIGRDACDVLFDKPIIWRRAPDSELPPGWMVARIPASQLRNERGHRLARLVKEKQTTLARDNAVRLAGGLSRRCRAFLDDGDEYVPIHERLVCQHCQEARRLRERSESS